FGFELLVGAPRLLRHGRGLLQRTFDRVAARKYFGDVAGGHLCLELGVRHRFRASQPILHRQDSEQDQIAGAPDSERRPAPALRRLSLRQSLGAPWTTLRLINRLCGVPGSRWLYSVRIVHLRIMSDALQNLPDPRKTQAKRIRRRLRNSSRFQATLL